jgi:hypothetical protein
LQEALQRDCLSLTSHGKETYVLRGERRAREESRWSEEVRGGKERAEKEKKECKEERKEKNELKKND